MHSLDAAALVGRQLASFCLAMGCSFSVSAIEGRLAANVLSLSGALSDAWARLRSVRLA
jgi:hypothetical protein